MDRDNAYLKHIKDAIGLIEEFVAGVGHKDFIKDKKVQAAVIRQLEIIGEAAKRLSDDFKESNKEIPWKDITGMRDKLIHDYIEVDIVAVWETVKQDIPHLKENLSE